MDDAVKYLNGNYLLEEALIGYKNIMGILFASAHSGTLLSLRCMIFQYHDIKSDVFIFNPKVTRLHTDYDVSCGKDISNALVKMLEKSEYTGAFCIEFKGNASMHFKFFDMNPRLCGQLGGEYENFFYTTYIPLAMSLNAIRSRVDKNILSYGWYSNPTMIEYVQNEKQIAMTGNDTENEFLVPKIRSLL